MPFVWIIMGLLCADQFIKFLVYYGLAPQEEMKIIGEWFRIRLELNDGTAFSNPFLNETDRFFKISLKFVLSIVLIYCLVYFVNKSGPKILVTGLALCIAGLLGNLADRVFHGVLLNNALDIYSTKWFHGRVVDMFYFPLFEFRLPHWFPAGGGEQFMFFEPVFNFADVFLVVGGILAFSGLIIVGKK